ncbi:SDR family oxidoreductase [Streptomyces sp. KM273126]|uniref:SDR family NAD(P)-dependent oxidoreductase n=1 Tax=Streptomyces sp. KM273126 TaxID=2545247 RepID=UPI00103B5486|nr:SDR family oxidoreductase [Streptomyces sp. KM273126]MBA2811204.1 SDR family oxidoreductase [Streptomyces sp. KM273126]
MQGKVALVTGATSGIGAAVAEALGRRGAHVLVAGRDAARGDAVVGAIRERGGEADFVGAELGDVQAVRRLAHDALELGGGRVDVVVNNAGIYPFGPTDDTEEGLFDAVYALNVKAPFYLVAELAPRMADRGSGVIVNVSTIAAALGFPGMALYGSSKAALNLLTKAWAAEYGPRGVRVNAVQVGPTLTETTAQAEEDLQSLAAKAPAGRPASVAEIAAAIAYLADDEASFVQGAVLPVDGGRTAV